MFSLFKIKNTGINLIEFVAKYSKKSANISLNYENKNPRNLEWSGHQYKRFGWNLEYPPKDFYHQCSFKKSRDGLEGRVEHSSGDVVVKASTDEIAFLQYLSSARDLNAAVNLGRLLADRCKNCGITNMLFQKSITFENSKKEQAFYKALTDNGIVFEEPDFKEKTENIQGLDYENRDFYSNKMNLPFPPAVNRLKKSVL